MSSILDFGKEDKSFVTKHVLQNILISHFRGISRLVRLIYFNELYPMNHNIRYVPSDSDNIEIFENGEFRKVRKEYAIDSVVMDIWYLLVMFFNEMEMSGTITAYKNSLVSKETFERIEAFVDAYEMLCNGELSAYIFNDIRNEVYDIIKCQAIEKKIKEEKKRKKRVKQPVFEKEQLEDLSL